MSTDRYDDQVPEEQDRLEAPFRQLDPVLAAFAARHGLAVARTPPPAPARTIAWGDNPRCMIQLWPPDPAAPALNLWICVIEDHGGDRHWRHEMLAEGAPPERLAPALERLLAEGRGKLLAWAADPDSLEFATTLHRP